MVGSLFGSFTNVLIHRLPLERDFVLDRSRCPFCSYRIPWFHNIPILSFVFLKGKCRNCHHPICLRYLFCEVFIGIMSLTVLPQTITTYQMTLFFYHLIIMTIFTAHFFIDLKHMILPNILNMILGILFFLYAFYHKTMWFGFQGFLVGLLLPLLVTLLFYYTSGKIGLGGGDIKLYAACGFVLGPMGVIQNIFLSCLLGTVVYLIPMILRKIDKNTMIPFGPFIIIILWPQIFWPKYFQRFISFIFP
jgi:leader peptidase (prepilin peptidase)/N-methyltransferase